MIRRYHPSDYIPVINLLSVVGMPIVSAEELEGLGFVWGEEGKILGFIWALVGTGKTAFMEHFCVHPDYRKDKDETGRSRIAITLGLTLLAELQLLGKTRIIGTVMETDAGKALEGFYNKIGMKFTKPHAFCHGNIKTLFDNAVKMRNGTHGNIRDDRKGK